MSRIGDDERAPRPGGRASLEAHIPVREDDLAAMRRAGTAGAAGRGARRGVVHN